MTQISQTESVRRRVRTVLTRYGASGDLIESILVQSGFYCGRRFCCAGYEAVWFLEEGELKFYEPGGAVFHAESLDRSDAGQVATSTRAAA